MIRQTKAEPKVHRILHGNRSKTRRYFRRPAYQLLGSAIPRELNRPAEQCVPAGIVDRDGTGSVRSAHRHVEPAAGHRSEDALIHPETAWMCAT